MSLKARLNSTAHKLGQVAKLTGAGDKIALKDLKLAVERGVVTREQSRVLWHALTSGPDRTVEAVAERLKAYVSVGKRGPAEGQWLGAQLSTKLETLRTADFGPKPTFEQTMRPMPANPGIMQQAFAAAQAKNPTWEVNSNKDAASQPVDANIEVSSSGVGVPVAQALQVLTALEIFRPSTAGEAQRALLAQKQAALEVSEAQLNRDLSQGKRGARLELLGVQRQLAEVKRQVVALTTPV